MESFQIILNSLPCKGLGVLIHEECQELEEIMGRGASHRGIYVSFLLSSLKNLSLFKLFAL